MLEVSVRVDDTTLLTQQMRERLGTLGPVLIGPIADSVRATFQAIFQSAGGYAVNGPWEPLSEATLARKPGSSAQILIDTDDLHQSLTQPNAVGSISELVDSETLAMGTELPYAELHQTGTRFMPARELLPDPWPEEDVQLWGDLATEYVVTGEMPELAGGVRPLG